MPTEAASTPYLIFRAGSQRGALPLSQVVEILRPLPLEPLSGAPAFVCGVSVIRGTPLPVVDLAALLQGSPGPASRFMIARAGERRFALAVDDVLGIREVGEALWNSLPPLLRDASPGAVEAMAVLDQETLLALKTGTLVPDSVWDSLEQREAR